MSELSQHYTDGTQFHSSFFLLFKFPKYDNILSESEKMKTKVQISRKLQLLTVQSVLDPIQFLKGQVHTLRELFNPQLSLNDSCNKEYFYRIKPSIPTIKLSKLVKISSILYLSSILSWLWEHVRLSLKNAQKFQLVQNTAAKLSALL